MNLITILDFVNVFFAGMLAGMEFVIHNGITIPAEVLDDLPQLKYRKAFVLRLRVLVPGQALRGREGERGGRYFLCRAPW